MTALSFFFSLIGASSFVGVALGIWQKYLADRFIESFRQSHASELEQVRNAFQWQLKQLEATLNRKHFVSKAQFDVEFSNMREAYALASEVLLHIRVIRPRIEHCPADEDEAGYKSRLSGRLQDLAEAHDKLLQFHERSRPFFTEQVYSGLETMSRAARFELNQVWSPLHSFRSDPWYLQGEENVKTCEEGHAALISSIRDRLQQLEAR